MSNIGGAPLGEGVYTITVRADGAITGLQQFEDSVKKTDGTVKTSFASMTSSMVGLAASSASLYFSFDQLERASIRVEQGHLRVEKAQASVNKLQKEGKTGTDEYTRAMQNLQIQQERYDVSQNMVNENMVFMSLSMVTLATSTIPSAIKAIQGLELSTRAFGAALDTVAPYLLAATAAFLAWEYAIAPVIKSQTGLDLGIQSNIEKLMKQHSTVQTSISDMGDLSSSYGTLDTSIQQSATSFDSWGTSVGSAASKVLDLDQALSGLSLMSKFDPFGDLSKSDPFSQLKDHISQVKTMQSDINEFMTDGKSLQEATTLVMDHYLLQLQEEKDNLHESNDQYQKKVDLLTQAVAQAEKLVTVTGTQLTLDKKKQQIISDLSKTTGLSEDIITASFTPGGFNANPALQELYTQGLMNFGSSFVATALAQSLSIRGQGYQVGAGTSASGVNISSLVGGLKNNDIWNSLVSMIADEHMFPGVSINTYNGKNAQAINNGEALSQSIFEQNDPRWQKFYALKGAGLFNGDPSLTLEENLDNAVAQYDKIFAPLRPDVAAQLEASHSSSHSYQLYADARSPGIRVTQYSYSLPTADELNLAKADSRYSSESEFQNVLSQARNLLGLDQNAVVKSLINPSTLADIQSELDYVNRLASMSSGATG
jgi:hypothetical protein